MDGGWAAVIAGASGAGGAALAAWATARAMIKQARLQANDRHEHWLREQRQEACLNLLAATDEVSDKLEPIIAAVITGPTVEDHAAWQEMNAAIRASSRTARRVSLLGPPALQQRAVDLHKAALSTVNVYRTPSESPSNLLVVRHAEAQEEWEAAEEAFRAIANQTIGCGALD
ncbi:hypothetical protein [Streptomyces venezuelae]|uniref:hypothetical protein n=1 Tax=Streptomyces venezuelae TaxID=54571 RepID=UPI003787CFDB